MTRVGRLLVAVAVAVASLTAAVPIGFIATLAGGWSGCALGRLPAEAAPAAYIALVDRAAERHAVPAAVIAAVIRVESGWDPQARSPAGALGLAQLMPDTARSLGLSDPTDPSQAIEGAARYLAAQLELFGDLELALAAYNAGPAAVRRHGGVPPYPETRAYVRKVLDVAAAYAGGMPAVACPPGEAVSQAGRGWGGFDNGRIPQSALASIGAGLYLRPDAAQAFLLMSGAHQRDLGYPIGVTDAYRDYATQVELAGRKPALAATPGTSNHGWGLAVDLVTGGWEGPTMRWLEANAHRFGWLHPAWARRDGSKPEPWHWEYVGVAGP